MNILLLKQIGLFSVLIGIIVALLTLVPFIGQFVFTIYFIMLSAGIIIYLKRNNILGNITVKEGGIIGAVIGFASFIAFSCVFIPLSALIGLIVSSWMGNIIAGCFQSVLTFMLLIFLLLFTALLCALMNGFSGAVTAYIYEVLAGMKQSEEQQKFELK